MSSVDKARNQCISLATQLINHCQKEFDVENLQSLAFHLHQVFEFYRVTSTSQSAVSPVFGPNVMTSGGSVGQSIHAPKPMTPVPFLVAGTSTTSNVWSSDRNVSASSTTATTTTTTTTTAAPAPSRYTNTAIPSCLVQENDDFGPYTRANGASSDESDTSDSDSAPAPAPTSTPFDVSVTAPPASVGSNTAPATTKTAATNIAQTLSLLPVLPAVSKEYELFAAAIPAIESVPIKYETSPLKTHLRSGSNEGPASKTVEGQSKRRSPISPPQQPHMHISPLNSGRSSRCDNTGSGSGSSSGSRSGSGSSTGSQHASPLSSPLLSAPLPSIFSFDHSVGRNPIPQPHRSSRSLQLYAQTPSSTASAVGSGPSPAEMSQSRSKSTSPNANTRTSTPVVNSRSGTVHSVHSIHSVHSVNGVNEADTTPTLFGRTAASMAAMGMKSPTNGMHSANDNPLNSDSNTNAKHQSGQSAAQLYRMHNPHVVRTKESVENNRLTQWCRAGMDCEEERKGTCVRIHCVICPKQELYYKKMADPTNPNAQLWGHAMCRHRLKGETGKCNETTCQYRHFIQLKQLTQAQKDALIMTPMPKKGKPPLLSQSALIMQQQHNPRHSPQRRY